MNFFTEADIVRDYCINHKLSRPTINWFLLVFTISFFETLVFICAIKLPLSKSSFLLFIEAVHVIMMLIFARVILQIIIAIYQRYAPESIRRQCTCMPTCSEYALLVLDKYCWPKALVLIIRRVTKTCQQPGYKIDYP